MAQRLMKKQRWQDAEPIAFLACACDQTQARHWLALGLAQAQLGKVANAVEQFQRATELDAGNVAAWTNYGEGLVQCNRYKEAEVAFRKAIDLDPDAKNPTSRRARMM